MWLHYFVYTDRKFQNIRHTLFECKDKNTFQNQEVMIGTTVVCIAQTLGRGLRFAWCRALGLPGPHLFSVSALLWLVWLRSGDVICRLKGHGSISGQGASQVAGLIPGWDTNEKATSQCFFFSH